MSGRHNGEVRKPWPHRVLCDTGGSFAMGAIGGSVYHFIRGANGAVRNRRVATGLDQVRMNGPRIGGSFAVFGGSYSIIDCCLVYIRQKEDPWNSIASGAIVAGSARLREGPRAMLGSALFIGGIFAMIQGPIIWSHKIETKH